MNGGYRGKLLFVDLSQGSIKQSDLDEHLARNFIGWYGLGVRILYDRMNLGIAPLGPGNILGFVPGPAAGTQAFFSGRYAVVCKSPVSGTWNDASSGGYFGPELKKAGFDAGFISGVFQKPVYLWIKDGVAELRSTDPAKYRTAGTGEMDLGATVFNELLNIAGLCMFCMIAGERSFVTAVTQAVTGFDAATQMAGITIQAHLLADNFFAVAGWDRTTGKPHRAVLEKLGGMEDVVKDLY